MDKLTDKEKGDFFAFIAATKIWAENMEMIDHEACMICGIRPQKMREFLEILEKLT